MAGKQLQRDFFEVTSPWDDGKMFDWGTSKPTDTTAGYAADCRFHVYDSTTGLTTTYVNGGSVTSCAFVATGEDSVDIDAGASGTAGTVDVFPSTASKGKFILSCTDQDGATNVTLKPAAMGQASVISIPDPGAATANVLLTSAANDGVRVTATAAEINQIDGNILADMTAGTGISTATNAICEHSVVQVGGIFKTEIVLDLTDLAGDGTNDDIIGKPDDTVNCHIGQILAAVNGTIFMGKMTCFETPAGGDVDVDLWYADEETGAQGALVTGLTNQIQTIDHGDWAAEEVDYLTAFPAADKYLYLAQGASTDATFTAGKFLIELWGTA